MPQSLGLGWEMSVLGASQAYTLCDKSHQNVVWRVYSTHSLLLDEGIQAKHSL